MRPIIFILFFLVSSCSVTESKKETAEVIISKQLLDFKRNSSDIEIEDIEPLSNFGLAPTIINDTLIVEFTGINSGGYHYEGNIEWNNDTLTLLLFDFNSEPMLEEVTENYYFKVKLSNKKPSAVRYKYQH